MPDLSIANLIDRIIGLRRGGSLIVDKSFPRRIHDDLKIRALGPALAWTVKDTRTNKIQKLPATGGHFTCYPDVAYEYGLSAVDADGIAAAQLVASGSFFFDDHAGHASDGPVHIDLDRKAFSDPRAPASEQHLVSTIKYWDISANLWYPNSQPRHKYFAYDGAIALHGQATDKGGTSRTASLTVIPIGSTV